MSNFLRFPNPGSDFAKFVATFQVIANSLASAPKFSLDDAVAVVVRAGQASSSGAVGEEALRRSTRDDRSRDPLYNQLKMYTEIYRMLGWVHPLTKKLDFKITDLGAHIAGAYGSGHISVSRLIQQCLASIAFPNPNTTGKGVSNVRPLMTILRFFDALDGLASRDELIIGVYTLADDTNQQAFDKKVAEVGKLRRQGADAIRARLSQIAGGIQTNTLKNYTRVPLGALKSPLINWALPEATENENDERVHAYRLTDAGKAFLASHARLRDVRANELSSSTQTERAHFLVLSHWVMYERTGVDLKEGGVDLDRHASGCARLLRQLKIGDPRDVLFSPYQQAAHSDLAAALSLTQT